MTQPKRNNALKHVLKSIFSCGNDCTNDLDICSRLVNCSVSSTNNSHVAFGCSDLHSSFSCHVFTLLALSFFASGSSQMQATCTAWRAGRQPAPHTRPRQSAPRQHAPQQHRSSPHRSGDDTPTPARQRGRPQSLAPQSSPVQSRTWSAGRCCTPTVCLTTSRECTRCVHPAATQRSASTGAACRTSRWPVSPATKNRDEHVL